MLSEWSRSTLCIVIVLLCATVISAQELANNSTTEGSSTPDPSDLSRLEIIIIVVAVVVSALQTGCCVLLCVVLAAVKYRRPRDSLDMSSDLQGEGLTFANVHYRQHSQEGPESTTFNRTEERSSNLPEAALAQRGVFSLSDVHTASYATVPPFNASEQITYEDSFESTMENQLADWGGTSSISATDQTEIGPGDPPEEIERDPDPPEEIQRAPDPPETQRPPDVLTPQYAEAWPLHVSDHKNASPKYMNELHLTMPRTTANRNLESRDGRVTLTRNEAYGVGSSHGTVEKTI